jgi:hypothetical protein
MDVGRAFMCFSGGACFLRVAILMEKIFFSGRHGMGFWVSASFSAM